MGLERAKPPSSQASDVVFAPTRRHLRPLLWTGTILEGLAVAGTLVEAVPAWAAAGLITGVPAASVAWHQRQRAKLLETQVAQLFHFDRKYEHYLTRWTFGDASPVDGYWAATHHAERVMVALGPIRNWTWSITRRADDDLPFYQHPPTLLTTEATRSGGGTSTYHPPHKQTATLAFRIEFDPPLRPGERVQLRFDLRIPVHKPGSLKLLRARPAPVVPGPGEVEFSSIDISYPIDSFVQELRIPERLGSTRHGPQVVWRDNVDSREEEFIRASDGFSIDLATIDGERMRVARLERQQPPLKRTYRLYWEPPRT